MPTYTSDFGQNETPARIYEVEESSFARRNATSLDANPSQPIYRYLSNDATSVDTWERFLATVLHPGAPYVTSSKPRVHTGTRKRSKLEVVEAVLMHVLK